MVTFHCQRVGCRYCDDSDNCHCPDNEVTFNINGKCSGYKNGVWHYITAVVVAMGRNTMIPSMELNTEVKIGIYFLSMLYDITCQYNEYGNWAWISFHEKDENVSNALDNDTEIIEKITGKAQKEELNRDYIYDYGFISPTGDFSIEEWGKHENLAHRIIKEKNWENEWDIHETGVDFLIYKKHYVLIHAPNGVDIEVTYNGTRLTKKQREFLYDYFINRGMGLRASLYMED